MRRRVIRNRTDRGAELRNRSLEIALTTQPAAGVGGEEGGLKVGFLFGELRAEFRFGCGTILVAELTKNGGERGVRAGEIRLQANRFAQRLSGFGELRL